MAKKQIYKKRTRRHGIFKTIRKFKGRLPKNVTAIENKTEGTKAIGFSADIDNIWPSDFKYKRDVFIIELYCKLPNYRVGYGNFGAALTKQSTI